ncbi:MAG: homocysteine S-methyltransferase family protein [Spirochaetales bacterium]|nr:homocysteine S-methyltransferase family protein [Spirochaetales bacterium]
MEDNGADILGANCGSLSPHEMAKIAGYFSRASRLPVIIQPDAGKPVLKDNLSVFEMDPEDFMNGIIECIDNGAAIVGGCCGTGPEHINVMAERIKTHLQNGWIFTKNT